MRVREASGVGEGTRGGSKHYPPLSDSWARGFRVSLLWAPPPPHFLNPKPHAAACRALAKFGHIPDEAWMDLYWQESYCLLPAMQVHMCVCGWGWGGRVRRRSIPLHIHPLVSSQLRRSRRKTYCLP